MLGRVIEWAAPARLGTDFRRLISATWLANLGDGIVLAAGPLLIASQTGSPVLIALASVLQRLPWFLFGLGAGVIADRVNRRPLVMAAEAIRSLILIGLAATIVVDQINVAIVLAAMFILGTAEVFTDIGTESLVPMIVAPADLGVANARFVFAHHTLNQLAGPPIGALLFAAGMALPFLAQAVLLALGVIAIRNLVIPPVGRGEPTSAWGDIVDGIGWLWRNPPVRTLTITIFTFNLTFGASFAMLVVYSKQRLGYDDAGFGLLLAASAVGGVIGAVLFDQLTARASLAKLMKIGLVVETLTHLGLGLTTSGIVAMAIQLAFGIQASVWGALARAVRQTLVPIELQGRVGSVYMLSVHVGLIIGSLLGGAIAALAGIVSVYLFAFAGSALLVVALWREFDHIALEATAAGR